MFNNKILCLTIISFIITGLTPVIAQEDVEGSEDHPMISRYEGSYILGYERYDYDRLVFARREDGDVKEIPAEGEVTRILYVAPEGLSSLQVHRNYQISLQNAGFEIIHEQIDEGDERSRPFFVHYNNPIDGYSDIFYGEGFHYLLAKLSRPEGDMHVSTHSVLSYRRGNQPVTALQVLEEKPLETGKVHVDMDAKTMTIDIDERIVSYPESDVEGSEDHPMISRYEGSVIQGYERVDYDRIVFPSGIEDGELQTIPAEGEITRILYVAPKGLSVLQVQRNYQAALRNAGFELVYECFGGTDEIPRPIFRDYDPGDFNLRGRSPYSGKDHSYFLARMPGAEGDIYVSTHTLLSERFDDHPAIALQIFVEKPMTTGMVQVTMDADAMASGLDESGKVLLYGIHFDTDEATLQEKSEPVLNEIATLLEQNPDLKLRVVGHTDAVGNPEYNMDLSQRRAEAVVEYLTSKQGVSLDRLKAHGVGSLAPVAGNETEEDRALNRRVELIKMYE